LYLKLLFECCRMTPSRSELSFVIAAGVRGDGITMTETGFFSWDLRHSHATFAVAVHERSAENRSEAYPSMPHSR
jgi:hypothetical protein